LIKRKRLFQSEENIKSAARVAMSVYSKDKIYNSNNLENFCEVFDLLRMNSVPLKYVFQIEDESFRSSLNQGMIDDINLEIEKYNLWNNEFETFGRILSQNNIRYIFIKTPGFFPYTCGNLDMLVEKINTNKTKSLLEAFGFIELKNIPEPHKWLYKTFDTGKEILAIHLHETVYWGGTFLDSKQIWSNFRNKKNSDNPTALAPEDLVLTTMAHSLYENATIRLLDFSIIKYLIENNSMNWLYIKNIAYIYKWIDGLYISMILYNHINKKIFGNDLIPKHIIEESNNYINKNILLKLIISDLLKSKLGMPFYIPIVLCKYLHYKKIIQYSEHGGTLKGFLAATEALIDGIHAYLGITKQKPMLIALSGLDGSGKSSYGSAIERSFEACGFKTEYIWARPGSTHIFRKMKDIFSKTKVISEFSEDAESPCNNFFRTNQIFRNKWIMLFWQITSLIDFCIYYNLKIWSAVLSKKIVICDRYILDASVDLYTYSNDKHISPINIKLFLKLLPKADKVIFLDVSPEVALERSKGKECFEYLCRQKELYDQILPNFNVDSYKAEKSLHYSCNKLINNILIGFYKKYS